LARTETTLASAAGGLNASSSKPLEPQPANLALERPACQ